MSITTENLKRLIQILIIKLFILKPFKDTFTNLIDMYYKERMYMDIYRKKKKKIVKKKKILKKLNSKKHTFPSVITYK